MNKLERLEALLDTFPVGGKRVLDAGTGIGVGTLALLRKGASSIVSVSVRASDGARAREQFPALRAGAVEFLCADLADLSTIPDGSFDVCLADYLVTAIDALTPGQHERVFSEVFRVVRPGGAVAVVDAEPVAPANMPAPLAELAALWRAATAHLGSNDYGSHSPRWVRALLERCGFETPSLRWLGSEDRGAGFVESNADGLRRMIESAPESVKDSLESRRQSLLPQLRDEAPFRGPRVFAVCVERPRHDAAGRGDDRSGG